MLTRYRRNTPTHSAFTRDPFFQFVDRFFNDAGLAAGVPAEAAETGWVPAMDIVENDDAFLAHADLPGLSKDDIEISVEDGMLSISGERKFEHVSDEENKGFKRLERSWGSFRRSFSLPQGVDLEKVTAAFADGVLTVTLPKSEIVKARKVDIH